MPKGLRIALDQGVNLGDPLSELLPGELRIARNSHYLPESSQLTKVKGRVNFGAAPATVDGLGFVRFRTAGRFLVAGCGTSYATAPVGYTGTWTTRASGLTAGGELEMAYYAGTDRLFLADGVNSIYTWDGTSASMRTIGMTAPSDATVTFLNNAGSSYVSGTTFQYCHTEVDSTTDTANPIESPPSGVVRIASSATDGTFKYALPASTTNANTDTIRVYRTQHGGGVFYLVAEFASTNLRYYDGTDSDALGLSVDNDAYWGFDTVDDLFLATRPVLPMLGSPLTGNYVTANGTAPIGNIMGFFDGSLFVAGVSAYPTDMYWSAADYPEQFSPVNFLREDEIITAAGVANDRLIIYTENGIHRLNQFPRTTDPGYGLGLTSRELVTTDHGCVARRSVVNFGVGQPNNRLFYVSTRGPMTTDGYETWPLNEDLDWSDRLFNLKAMDGAIARNFPKYQQVWLFLPSRDSKTNDIAMVYHYHPNHAKKNGVGKWTGPVHVRCGAATTAYETSTESTLYTADTNGSGNVYLEDTGNKDNQLYDDASGGIRWEWETGDHPLGEESADKRVHRVFINAVGTADFNPTLSYSMSKRDKRQIVPLVKVTDNTASTTDFGESEVSTLKTRSYRGGVWQKGSHLRLHMAETAVADRAIATVEVEVESYGRQK